MTAEAPDCQRRDDLGRRNILLCFVRFVPFMTACPTLPELGGHTHDGLSEGECPGRAEEPGIAAVEDAAVGGHQPVAPAAKVEHEVEVLEEVATELGLPSPLVAARSNRAVLLTPVDLDWARFAESLGAELDGDVRIGIGGRHPVEKVSRSLEAAAAALPVHRNTLRYRLSKIGQITGRDLADPDQRFQLELACRARVVLQALETA